MIMMQLGRGWLAKKGISQEMLDSSVLTFFGVLLIFTMHNPLGTGSSRWSHKDMNVRRSFVVRNDRLIY